MHGKVETKIKHVQESFSKCIHNDRLSVIQWETLGDQIANSINNLPIGVGNVVDDLENLDILTPNRLIVARNNDRCPIGTINVSEDVKKIIQTNNKIFETWFKCWLVSFVPKLMSQPKWFKSDRDSEVGDVVLFLKADKEFDKHYQYGIITKTKVSRDGKKSNIKTITKTRKGTQLGVFEMYCPFLDKGSKSIFKLFEFFVFLNSEMFNLSVETRIMHKYCSEFFFFY